jgi:hypothetical protein
MSRASELAIYLAENEWVELSMDKKAFIRIKDELDYEEYYLKKIEIKDFDYSYDETWNNLKGKSVKAYKELKNHEYDLRQKINEDAKKEEKSAERNG